MTYAKDLGATVVAVVCNDASPMAAIADIAITAVVGPEVVTGSSRMKAGTAQKLILNMLTTGAMIRSGKVYGNLMVDVQASNEKLIKRQIHIVQEASGCDAGTAQAALEACDRHCKTAIVMVMAKVSATEARHLLAQHHGFIRPALASHRA
jgi:N-acetylmuramic acid 6-phosphate etherase